MIMEGVWLMAVGMFTVFAFLTLLVGLMKASTSFFETFSDRFPEPPPERSSPGGGAGRAVAPSDEAEIALAIAVAAARMRGAKRG
jgi:sodium pump decarboxylase gamma subunit